MPESNVNPKKITIRMLKPGSMYLYIRTDVRSRVEEDMSGDKHTLYEYDERQIKIPFECAAVKKEAEKTKAREYNQTCLKEGVLALIVKGAEMRQAISASLSGSVTSVDRLEEESETNLGDGIDADAISAWTG